MMSVGAGGGVGTGVGAWYTAPPDLSGAGACATAVAGRTSVNDVETARANARRESNLFLFRRPTGLADGLTLKEPASHACCVTRPNCLGPPSSSDQLEARRARQL